MSAWLPVLDGLADLWAEAFWRASCQGTVVLAGIWLVCRLLPGLPGNWRCVLWRLGYLKLLIALFWATPFDLPLLPPTPAQPIPATVAAAPAPVSGPVLLAGSSGVPVSASHPASLGPVSAPAPAAPGPRFWLFLAWLLAVSGYLGCVVRQWWRAQQLRRRAVPVESRELKDCFAGPAALLRLRQAPDLGISDVPAPVLIGGRPPLLVLPGALAREADPSELRLVLAHELAHLRRGDLSWGWFSLLTQGLFFFHPLVWLAGHECRLAQEMACDAVALEVTQSPPAAYGGLLLRVAAHNYHRTPGEPIALGLFSSHATLRRRLKAMYSSPSVSRRQWRGVGVFLLIITLAASVPWRLTAQEGEGTTGSPPPILRAGLMRVSELVVSPDGKTLASAGGSWRGSWVIDQVELWDLETDTLKQTLPGEIFMRMLAVQWQGAGTVALASLAWDRKYLIHQWDAATGRRKRQIRLPVRMYFFVSAALSPDGRSFAVSGFETDSPRSARVQLWSLSSGKRLRVWKLPGVITALSYSRDGRVLIGLSEGGHMSQRPLPRKVVYSWDLASGGPARTVTMADVGRSQSPPVFSPDKKRVAMLLEEGAVAVMEVQTGKLLRKLSMPRVRVGSRKNPGAVTSLAFSADGKLLAVGNRVGLLSVWDTATGQRLRELKGQTAGVDTMAFTPDGRTLVSGGGQFPPDPGVRVWRLQ